MVPGVVLVVFALIFVAELPDKTMIALLVLGSRSRPVAVWLGAVAAFAIHAAVAVAAGRLLELLPHRWVEGVTAALFAAGAVYLLAVPEREEQRRGEEEALRARTGLRTAAAAFLVILVGELGDLTQLLTANLAARFHAPLSVFLGAFAALTAAAAVGAFGGRWLRRFVPLGTVRKGGGVVLAGFALYSVLQLAGV
jgi:putative Ca2+/H+ antiporter (TMEM165/GDT1 family)